MRRSLVAALVLCLTVAGYLALQPLDADEVAVVETSRQADAPRAVPAQGASKAGGFAAALSRWRLRDQAPGLPPPDQATRQSWGAPPQQQPAPTVATVEPPEPLMAPPFPLAWVGRYLDPAPRAIVAGAAGTWVVAEGDVMDGQWRVDAIKERRMTLTYLPLSQSQTVGMK